MKNVVLSNGTLLGGIAGFALSGIIAAIIFRYFLVFRLGAQYGVIVGIFIWSIIFAVLYRTLDTRQFTFDSISRKMIVQEKWLICIEGGRCEYSFDDVKEIGNCLAA